MLKDTPQFELETKQCTNLIDVLSVSPIEEDHVFFESVLSYSNWTLCPNTTWMVSRSSTGSAFAIELESGIPIVVCECDVFPGRWKKILEQIAPLRNPPLLIVTSRLADEHLWAEALNLGAYDVLAKPFDRKEVSRIFSQAWLHWHDQYDVPATAKRLTMSASGT